jgi:hypothetical protein
VYNVGGKHVESSILLTKEHIPNDMSNNVVDPLAGLTIRDHNWSPLPNLPGLCDHT